MSVHASKAAEAARVMRARSMAGVAKALETVDPEIREDVRRMVRVQINIFKHDCFRMGWCPGDVYPSDYWGGNDGR